MISEGKLEYPDGKFILYKQRKAINFTKPGIIYLAGYGSNLNCKKAEHVDRYCLENGLSCLRFDYFGHTYSSGKLAEATLSIWKQNFLDVLDKLTTGYYRFLGPINNVSIYMTYIFWAVENNCKTFHLLCF